MPQARGCRQADWMEKDIPLSSEDDVMRSEEEIKAKVADSMPTRLAFPERVGEGFQIVLLTTLESLILRRVHSVIVLSFLQH